MVAYMHVHQGYLKTFDEFGYPKGFWTISAVGVVEDVPVDEASLVMASHHAMGLDSAFSLSRGKDFVKDSFI